MAISHVSLECVDGENVSIAKYPPLNRLSITQNNRPMMYAKALEYNQANMVVTYIPSLGTPPLMLDNINRDIVGAKQRLHLKPIPNF